VDCSGVSSGGLRSAGMGSRCLAPFWGGDGCIAGVSCRATVRIRNTETNATRTVATDEQGNYQAPRFRLDVRITCEAKGFRSAIARGITLAVDQRARVDIQLEVGALEQSIEVSSRPPLIETDTASQGT